MTDETNPESEAAFDTPTLVSNRFVITHNDTHTRIAFGEVIAGSKTRFRVAVQLENADADALAELIERLHVQHANKKDKA